MGLSPKSSVGAVERDEFSKATWRAMVVRDRGEPVKAKRSVLVQFS